ncbi:sugar transferase [Microbacterium sp. NPDC055357]
MKGASDVDSTHPRTVSTSTSSRAPRQARAARRTGWRRSYARRLALSDLLVLAWVVYGTQILWFGFAPREVAGLNDVTYWAFSAVLVGAWMLALALADTRSPRVMGVGSTEYVRVADASLRLFGLVAILAFLLRIDVARGFLLISLPLGIVVLTLERWLWRKWLVAHRVTGRYSARVVLVGSEGTVAQVGREFERSPGAGYRVVGACTASTRRGGTVEGTSIPRLGDVDDLFEVLTKTGADTVAVTSTDDLPAEKVKQISWRLESGRQHLVLAPNILDIAGPRIHTRPVAGLPLIHVETPRFTRGQRVTKRTFDVCASLGLIVVLSPLLVAVAVAVAATSAGGVLYRHRRVGMQGQSFDMLKFRSMRKDADRELARLLARQGTSDRPLFKVTDDPRITAVGRFIRKHSLDELPQLFNVLGGSMSIVGPRPQIAAEVALYSPSARRRLLARPGMTGLWQVNGRSALSWEEAVRLDLYYVENWSFLGDLAILLRTVKEVIAPGDRAH